jgi:hypothetical protein
MTSSPKIYTRKMVQHADWPSQLKNKYNMGSINENILAYVADVHKLDLVNKFHEPVTDQAWRLMGKNRMNFGCFDIGQGEEKKKPTVHIKSTGEKLSIESLYKPSAAALIEREVYIDRIGLYYVVGPVAFPTPIDQWAYTELTSNFLMLKFEFSVDHQLLSDTIQALVRAGSYQSNGGLKQNIEEEIKTKELGRVRDSSEVNFLVSLDAMNTVQESSTEIKYDLALDKVTSTLTKLIIAQGVARGKDKALRQLMNKNLTVIQHKVWGWNANKAKVEDQILVERL